MVKKEKKESRDSQIYQFSLRMSVPKDKCQAFAEGECPAICKFVEQDLGADKWIFQLENSHLEKTEEELKLITVPHNLHYQVWFHIKVKARIGQMKKRFMGSKYKSWSHHISMASDVGKLALQRYCMKDDTRVAGPFADKPIYLGADLITPEKMIKQQRQLLKYLLNYDPIKYGKRISLWIYCKDGGSGKSAFKKYCAFKYGWPGFTYAKSDDILYTVSKFPMKRCYFFNLSKTKQAEVSEKDLYAALEAIKDGDFLSSKYDSKHVLMNPCHVVVFANHLPNLDNMTRKRFRILRWKPLPKEVLEEIPDFDFGCEEMDDAEVRRLKALEIPESDHETPNELKNKKKRKRIVANDYRSKFVLRNVEANKNPFSCKLRAEGEPPKKQMKCLF